MITRLDRLQGRDIYENTALAKINELVDAVNDLKFTTNHILEEKESEIKVYEEARDMYDNAILDALKDKQVDVVVEPAENVLTKSLRMDKEFAEDECVRLQKELNYTQKALGVAFDALNTIKSKKDVSQGCFWTLSQSDILDVILRAEKEIKRITKGGDNE